eukprot:4997385-Prymnesium_polylepis.1
MLQIIDTSNDRTEDVHELLLLPQMVEEQIVEEPQGAVADQLGAAFAGNAGSKTKKRKKAVAGAKKPKWVISHDKVNDPNNQLRNLIPDILDIKTGVDTGGDGGRDAALDSVSDEWRLVFLPNVPDFDGGDLETALPDHPD